MKKLAIIVILFGFIPCVLHARLEETLKEVAQRYGEPVNSSDPESDAFIRVYRLSGIVINVCFLNGKSVAEIFKPDTGRYFKDTEINAILAANNLGSSWQKTFSQKADVREGQISDDEWILESGAAKASCVNSYNLRQLFIKKPNDCVEFNKIIKKREEDKKPGF